MASSRIMSFHRLLCMYEKLWTSGGPDIDEFVLFPAGTVSIPTTENDLQELLMRECRENGFKTDIEMLFRKHDGKIVVSPCPVLLFPKLVGWSKERPPTHLRNKYRDKLRRAINALNSAGIAHLDLRPDNIMWKEDNGDVSVRLIDFDDAYPFEYVIPEDYVSMMAGDINKRYPFALGDERHKQVAKAEHNEFFYKTVEKWLNEDSLVPTADIYPDVSTLALEEK